MDKHILVKVEPKDMRDFRAKHPEARWVAWPHGSDVGQYNYFYVKESELADGSES